MSEQLQAFLDQGTSFQGKICFDGVVRVDGHFQGDIRARGMLVVGETGRVEANLEVGSLVVRGAVVGEVQAKERVEIAPEGRIEGSITTPVLKIDDGARVIAKITMAEPTLAAPPAARSSSRE